VRMLSCRNWDGTLAMDPDLSDAPYVLGRLWLMHLSVSQMTECSTTTNTRVNKRKCDLWLAARVGDLQRVAELVERGHDPNAVNEYDATPLYNASLCGHVEVVKVRTSTLL
jgi:hypothetical protein